MSNRTNARVHSVKSTSTGEYSFNMFAVIKYFYTAPITKFIHTCLAYLLFLGLFSYFVLTDLYPMGHPNTPSITEITIWCWAVILFLEEVRQIFSNDTRTTSYNFKDWFSDTWNKFDFVMYITLVTSVIFRLLLPATDFIYARSLYAVTLSMFYLRFSQVFYVHPNIGPKVIMIKKMLMDLLFFIVLVVVFILSYGVGTQAMLYPNAKAEWLLLKRVFYSPYWQIYADPELDWAEGQTDSVCSHDRTKWLDNSSVSQCPESNWLVPVYLVIYILLTNVLLLNLLIAMFSFTFQEVQANSELVWRFNRYSLVYEYYDKPELAPPFSVVLVIYRLLRYVFRKCRNRPAQTTDFRVVLKSDENLKMTTYEKYCMERYLVSIKKVQGEELDAKVSETEDAIKQANKNLDEIREHVNKNVEDVRKVLELIRKIRE